ncbi:hypothetical protein D3C75_1060120 [compost metagenome]
MVQVKCVCNRASSLFSRHVVPVVDKVKLLKIHAANVMVQVYQIVSKLLKLLFLQVLIMVIAFA